MRRRPLYSASGRTAPKRGSGAAPLPRQPVFEPEDDPPGPNLFQRFGPKLKAGYLRFERPILALGAAALALGVLVGFEALQPKPKVYTQADIDAAVAYNRKRYPEPSHAMVAAEKVRPSVVRVTGYDPRDPAKPGDDKAKDQEKSKGTGVASGPDDKSLDPTSVGSGVVMSEDGSILTNLHVAASAQKLTVTFYNGLVSEAEIVGVQSADDLAVIKAKQVPDDLKPATMVSTANLKPGDEVTAVGFPFGIGPSVSSGVVSGLKREWVFDKDRRARNLIQFDAAANPGNSGGPLVNRNGEVVGIVTGILNPTKQAFFVGIGFAVPIENAAKAVGRSPF